MVPYEQNLRQKIRLKFKIIDIRLMVKIKSPI